MAFAVTAKSACRVAAGARRSMGVSRMSTVAVKAALEFKPLPYAMDAFEPLLSKESFEYHYGKHHRTYYDNLLKQIAGTEWEKKTLEEIVVGSYNNGNPTPAFNNAAQIWNHTFFWESMKPNGGGAPTGKLAEAITRDFGSLPASHPPLDAPATAAAGGAPTGKLAEAITRGAPTGKLAEAITRDFGSLDAFKAEFKTAGLTQFGSGWAWLVTDKSGKLSVSKTPNAVLPVVEGKTPILTCDVWEHAYYIDYRNRRPDFIQTFLDKLVDWESVSKRYAAAH